MWTLHHSSEPSSKQYSTARYVGPLSALSKDCTFQGGITVPASLKFVGGPRVGTAIGPRSQCTCPVFLFPILSALRFPVWKRRNPFLCIFDSAIELGSQKKNRRENAFDRLLANMTELYLPSLRFWIANRPRETRMSDLSFQLREVWKQPDRLPAEERPGTWENTSKLRRCLLSSNPWPSSNICHLLGIRSLVTWLDCSLPLLSTFIWRIACASFFDSLMISGIT
jgi:hypothetical protein